MNQLTGDIRSGLRLLVRYPTLSLVAVLTLGLGIGLGTTVFCVVNGALFKGLPFPDADRIVALVATNPSQQQPRQPISSQDLAVWQERQTAFEPLEPACKLRQVCLGRLSAKEVRMAQQDDTRNDVQWQQDDPDQQQRNPDQKNPDSGSDKAMGRQPENEQNQENRQNQSGQGDSQGGENR
jgi:hypothetical protein